MSSSTVDIKPAKTREATVAVVALVAADSRHLPARDREEFSRPAFDSALPAGAAADRAAGSACAVYSARREWQDFTQYNMIFAIYYGGLILRTVVFFGCAWIFMNLFRGDIIDRSLHFYFLSPVRREVLVVGKYFRVWSRRSFFSLAPRHLHVAALPAALPFGELAVLS